MKIKLAVLLTALFACSAFAQTPGVVTPGGALKKRAYQTYAAATYYVDPTGSDSNACTATGTDACLTLQGAVNKVPRFIRHIVTINVAAGTYATATIVDGFNVSGAGQLVIKGSSWTNSTLASGSVTGSVTTYTAPTFSPPVLGSLSSVGQTWTVNDLKGHFLTMTSGTAINTHRVITGNTATTIELNTTITGVQVGDTYVIQDPAALFTAPLTVSAISGATTLTSTGIVVLDSFSMLGSGGSLGQGLLELRNSFIGDPAGTSGATGIFLRNLKVISTATGRFAVHVLAAWVTCASAASSYFANNTVAALAVFRVDPEGRFDDQASYIRQESASASVTGPALSLSGANGLVVGNGVTAFGVYEAGSSATSFVAPAALTSHSSTVRPNSFWFLNALFRASSGYGLVVAGSNDTILVSGARFEAVNALDIRNGARVTGQATLPYVFSGVTNEVTIDGTVYTYAFFTALSPKRVQGNQGSTFYTP